MSDSQQVGSIKKNLFSRLGLFWLVVLFGAALLFVSYGTASAQRNNSIGRGFTGVVTSVDTNTSLLTVESKGAVFQLRVAETTVISNPPDKDVGLAGLPPETRFRIAGLVDKRITDDEGSVTTQILTAQRIIVVPGKATRSHRRVIAVDTQGDTLTTLDDDGNQKELPARGLAIQKGDLFILLLQNRRPTRAQGFNLVDTILDDTIEKILGLYMGKTIDDRLERLSRSETDDPLKVAVLSELRGKLDEAREKHLRKTADRASAVLREFVLATVRNIKENREARQGRGGPGRAIAECARSIAGSRSNSIRNLNADQRQRITNACLSNIRPASDESPVVRITSPASGTIVSRNEVVLVTAEAKDDVGVVSVTFKVAGTVVATLTEAPYSVMVTVPADVSSLRIQATALDADGNEGSDAITLPVARTAELGIKIVSPVERTSANRRTGRPSTVSGSSQPIAEGDTIIIRAEISGVGAVTVIFTVNGEDQAPVLAPPYLMTYFVPFSSSAAAPEPLRITATATDGSGDVEKDSVTIDVIRKTTVVNVKITNPPPDAKITGGETIVIRAETDNDSGIAFVTFSRNDES